MVTLTKYGAKYNRLILYIEGLSTDLPKPTVYFYEYDDNGREISKMAIQNGSIFTEIDTGKTFMYDAQNTTWYEVAIGGGGASGGLVLQGVTTTQLTEGATTNPITINGQSYTAQANDMAIYGYKEFYFDGTYWHEFGDYSGLGTAAYKDVPTSGDASTTQVVMGNDTRIGAIAGIKAVTDRIIMDGTETQDYYLQDSTPSNPSSGDYWFSDEPIVSSDVTAMTGYAKASSAAAIATTDTLNQAVGKLEKGLDGKQATIDANNKLSSDLVDDTNKTNKFATAEQLAQIQTNKNDILSEQAKTTGMTEGGSNYIVVGGIRVYVSATAPTGNIPDGSVGVGW